MAEKLEHDDEGPLSGNTDTRQTLHDLMGRRWKAALLVGPLTVRQTVEARGDGSLAVREVRPRGDDQRGLALYNLASPERTVVLSPAAALELLDYLRGHEEKLREMAESDSRALLLLRQRVEG